ncbi:MAG TPA: DUF2752 domain-containing protein [Mucilaginibacter sp.]|jgi:hypothetical protein|nr:DUF2752 domain-containing protein [Mucilaginibacter sp.]
MLIKKRLYFALTFIGVVAFAIIYYRFNPAKYSFFPKCPFHSLTGLDCPGCGSQRAFYFLLHGNIPAALSENVLLVASIPFLLVHFFYKVKSVVLQKDCRWGVIYHPLTPKIIFVLVVVFGIVRNIPGHPFSYLSAGQ